MTTKWLSMLAVGLLGATIAVPGRAADHVDSPAGSNDPTADITDLLTFKSPEKPGRLVLVLNVHPAAFKDAKFSDKVTYSFRVRPDAAKDAKKALRELRVDCTFDDAATQNVACTAYKFEAQSKKLVSRPVRFSGPVNETAPEKDGLRVFAGMRADQFFIDAAGVTKSFGASSWQFTGTNALKGMDVLSIVVEVDVADLAEKGTSVLRAAAETSMRVKS